MTQKCLIHYVKSIIWNEKQATQKLLFSQDIPAVQAVVLEFIIGAIGLILLNTQSIVTQIISKNMSPNILSVGLNHIQLFIEVSQLQMYAELNLPWAFKIIHKQPLEVLI